MGSARDLVFEILAIDGASAVFKKVGTEAEAAGAKVEASGGAFSKLGGLGAMALAGVAAGAGILGAKVIHMGAEFQSSMNLLVTSAGESQKNLGMVGNGVKQIAVDTATTTQNLSRGMYMIESAGFHGAAGLQVLRSAAEGAKSEGADLDTVGNALTTAMTDYHLSADKARQTMNLLIATTSAGKTHLEDLAAAFPMVGPVAASLHVSLTEVGAAMATMTSQGNSAEVSAMDLAAAMSAIIKPNANAQKEMLAMGITSKQVAETLSHQGLSAALNMVTEAAGKHFPAGSAAYNHAVETMMGKMPAFRATLALTGENAKTMAANMKNVGEAFNKSGKHVEGFDVVQKSFNFRLQQFHQQLDVTGITIGQKLLPMATMMVGGFLKIIPAIQTTTGWLERNKPVTIGLAVAIGAAMVPALYGMATAAWAAAAGFIAANAPIIAIAAAIGLLVAGVVYAYQHWTWFRTAVQDTAKAIKIAAEWMWTNGIKPVFDALKTYITTIVIPWFKFLWDAAKVVFTGVGMYVSFMWHNVVSPIFNLIKTYISNIVVPWFMFLWEAGKKVFGGIGVVVTALWGGVISPVFKLIVSIVKFTVETWWALFSFLWKHIWNDFGQPIYKFLSQNLPDWFKTGYRLFDQFFIQPWKLGFTLLYQWIWNDFGQKIYNFLVQTLPRWFSQGVQLLKHAWGMFAGAVLVPVNWVIQNVWNGGVEKIWNAAAGVFNGPTLSPVPMLAVAPGFQRGGQVPGSGSGDIVPAMLEPGEFVLPKAITRELWPILAPHAKGFQSGGLVGGILGGLGSILSPLKNMILGGLEAAARAAFGGVNALLGHVPGAGTPLGQLLISAVKTGENDILALLHKKDQASGGPVVAAAKSQLGVPYSWGGGGPDGPSYGFAQGAGIKGFDCSSLMQYAYWQGAHKLLPRTTYEQVTLGRPVASQQALLPGDLVFPYADIGHVMMVAAPGASGPNGMIEAPHTGANVRMNSFYAMDGGARRILGYRNGGFIGPGEIGLVGEVGPELVTGGRSGATIHPIKGGDGSFMATIELKLDGQVIDRQLVKFQNVGGTLQSSQNEIKRTVVPSARNQ